MSTSEHDHGALLSPHKLLGEDFEERMLRFGLIVENAHGNWDLSDRDENAIRTANALMLRQRDSIRHLQDRARLLEDIVEIVRHPLYSTDDHKDHRRFLAACKALDEFDAAAKGGGA